MAVNAEAVATPSAPVTAVVDAALVLPNLPEAPDGGAVNVTVTPETGLPFASTTVTPSAVPNAVPTVVDCGVVPLFALRVFGAPAVIVSCWVALVSDEADAVIVGEPALVSP